MLSLGVRLELMPGRVWGLGESMDSEIPVGRLWQGEGGGLLPASGMSMERKMIV